MAADKPSRGPGRPCDQQLIKRRREQILCAASQVFAEQGFGQTEVQAIADASGISKGTIYRYFPSKHELFLACVDEGMHCLQQAVQQGMGETTDPLQRMSRAVRSYLGFFDAHPHLVELLLQERAEFRDRKKHTYFEHHDANAGRWRDRLARMMREGRVREMPVDRIIDFVGDLLYGVIFTSHFRQRARPVDELADDLVDIAFFGIATDAERRQHLRDTSA